MNPLFTRFSASGLLLAFGALACGGDADVAETPSDIPAVEQAFLKGHAIFGHEVRSIRPCGEDEALWAIDSTQLIWGLFRELAPGMEPYEEVFVVVQGIPGDTPLDGFGADYPGSFNVDRVVYAAVEGWGCDLDLGRFDYRLSGNEPFWTLNLFDDTAELSRIGAPGRTWNDLRMELIEAEIRYSAEDSESGSLVVSLTEEPCRDSMSGAYYGYGATVVLDDDELHGCALRGTGP